MSMFSITGTLVNTYRAPLRKGADSSETEKDKIQILGDIPLPNGEVRKDLISITVPDVRKYEGEAGTQITLSVGVFAAAKGQIIYFINK
jgi:hypothetical protein